MQTRMRKTAKEAEQQTWIGFNWQMVDVNEGWKHKRSLMIGQHSLCSNTILPDIRFYATFLMMFTECQSCFPVSFGSSSFQEAMTAL